MHLHVVRGMPFIDALSDGSFIQHLRIRPNGIRQKVCRHPVAQLNERMASLGFHRIQQLILPCRRRCAALGRIREYMNLRKADFLRKGIAFPEILLGFSGEADNDIRCQRNLRQIFPERCCRLPIFLRIIFAVHFL